MKVRIIILFVFLLSLLGSCAKEDPLAPNGFKEYQHEAVIIGYYEVDDCVGGYAMNFINDPDYTRVLHTLALPEDVDITPLSSFPIKVVLNWEWDSTYCPGADYILIKKMMKLD